MLDRNEYKSYAANFLTEMDLTVFAVRRLASYRQAGASVQLTCEAVKCKKVAMASSAKMTSRYFVNVNEDCTATVRLDFISDDVVRIRLQKGGEVQEISRLMLLEEPAAAGKISLTEEAGCLLVHTPKLTLRVDKQPFSLCITDKNGNTLYSQYNDDLHSTTNDRRRGLNEAKDELDLELIKASYPALEVYPFGFVQHNQTGEICYTEAVKMAYNEAFFGFGESFGPGNKSGEEKYVWTINPLGVSTIKSYKVVPFFMSSRGYGLYLNSPRKNVFDMGSYFFKAYTVSSFDRQLDLFFINGPDYASILKRYTALTGECRNVPPKWSFGSWMGRNCYHSRTEIEDIAKELRRRKLPCDVLHLDWDWTRSETAGFDFEFDEARYPDPAGMIKALGEEGYRLSLWQLPYLRKGTPIYNEAREKGYLSTPPPHKANEEDDNGIIDFSNPDAFRWYQEKLRRLLKMGVAVIKTDFGENAEEDYLYHGMDGADMHNLYPLLYNIAAYEVCEEVLGKEALVWGRSAYAGNQRFPLYWGGDSDSDYLGLFHSLRGGLSLGLSGFPFWSYDVGGYYARPDTDVYIRWVELGMLSSHIRFHGTTAREPWHYGEEAVAVYRKYAEIRYSLIEYLYSEAHYAVQTSTPLMRHLVLDFQGDPTVQSIDDQFMLGRNIMVVGVFGPEPTRRLYLPSGRWMDWHTNEILDGPRWIDRPVPLDTLPIYLRFGTATPLVEPKLHTTEKPDKYIRWKILPENGRIHAQVLGLSAPVTLNAAVDGQKQITLDIHDPLGLQHIFELHGIAAKPARLEGAQDSVYNADTHTLRVEMLGGAKQLLIAF